MKPALTLNDLCASFGCDHIDELDALYLRHDQDLMKNHNWDYLNDSLPPNRIRAGIESLDVYTIADTYERWRTKEILWLWYHHAISCALWRYGDEDMARIFAKKALEYHQADNPNRITNLLYLLVHRREKEAKEYVSDSIDIVLERDMALHLLRLYEDGLFFTPQVREQHTLEENWVSHNFPHHAEHTKR